MADSKKDFFKEIKDEFKDLGSKVNQIFDDLIRVKNKGEYRVFADSYQTEGEFIWELDLPGFEKSDVKVQLKDENLVVSGKRSKPFDKDKSKFFIQEREFGSFEKIFVVPDGADPNSIKAKFENGVLRITMPRNSTNGKHNINID